MYKEFGCLQGKRRRFQWGSEGGRESPLPGARAPLSRLSVFENKNRTGNSMSVRLLVCPRPPTAVPKSLHTVPSIYRATLVNTPSLKKKEEKKQKT